MNNSGSAVKIILSVLAAASVILLVIFIVKSCGSTPDDIDGTDDVANYGIVETSQTDVSDTDIFIPDNSTIEMDEIPSNADVYAEEAAD